MTDPPNMDAFDGQFSTTELQHSFDLIQRIEEAMVPYKDQAKLLHAQYRDEHGAEVAQLIVGTYIAGAYAAIWAYVQAETRVNVQEEAKDG